MALISNRLPPAARAALFALGLAGASGAAAAADADADWPAATPYEAPSYAAPAYEAPLRAAPDAVAIEPVYWTNRCFWVNGPWGPQRRCRQVWVGGRPGWGPPPPRPGWGPPPPRPGWGPPPPGPGWGPPPPRYRPPPGDWRY